GVMDSEAEEWIPLRQAVLEVSAVYAETLGRERGSVVDDAISAIDRQLTAGSAIARSPLWVLDIAECSGCPAVHYSNTESMVISDQFWLLRSRSTETYCNDWVAGELSFAVEDPQAHGF